VDRELHPILAVARDTSSAGFTLVEVLTALALVSVLVAGAAGLLNVASTVIRSARLSTTASLLALQKVEQLRASPVPVTAGTRQDSLAVDGSPAPPESAVFVRRWTVTSAWAASPSSSVIVEVLVRGAGPVAELQAVVGSAGGGPS